MVSWNTREKTLACLDSIPLGLGETFQAETIVIDNGSHDGSREALASRPDIHLVANDLNFGYAVAVNQAFALARGDLILLLNSDILFTPRSLHHLIEFLQAHDDAAGVGPTYLNPDGSPQAHHYRLPTFTSFLGNSSFLFGRIDYFRRQVRSYRMLDDDFSRPRRIEQPSASCLLLRRHRMPDPLLDERFPIYFNDVALARILSAARGEQLWMTPESVVYHDHGASTRLMGSSRLRQYLGAQIRYLHDSTPWYAVGLFRAVVFTEHVGRILVRHPGAMQFSDTRRSPPRRLWHAPAGNGGRS